MTWLSEQFELARGAAPGAGHEGPSNIRPMEGLRGFAVLLVFLVHYVTTITPWLAPATPLFALARALHTVGNSGVDLFFVLSGYLIYGSLIARPQAIAGFLRRRLRRIYPAFSAVFLIYLALSYAIPGESKIPAGLADGSLYLARNFLLLSGFDDKPPMIAVAWSLSYEMLYYLTIPGVIAVFDLRRRGAAWRLAFLILAVGAAAAGFAVFGGPARLLMFAAGIFLVEAEGVALAPRPGGALLALLLGLACLLTGAALIVKVGALFAAFFWLCLACFHAPHGWLARGFSRTALRWLGNMSYSYYLLHGLALKVAFHALAAVVPASPQGPLFFWGLLTPMLILTLLPPAALFLLVERPLSLAPRRAAAPALAAARP
ncbi:MAG TPA: acyltransferase [Janthinobacterium sp.]|nr:acyltransferase [Janthinobacterium sp.]